MSDEYLWSGKGERDAETQRLESLLSRFQYGGRAPEWPARGNVSARGTRKIRWKWMIPALALAAAMAMVVLWRGSELFEEADWRVESAEGAPVIGKQTARPGTKIHAGDWLETDGNSRLRIKVDGLGEIEVEPNSRLRLVEAKKDAEHVQLEGGTIHASITADPYVFLVRTPSAYALDMGCAYTLGVSEDGSGLLRVTLGWVEFQHGWNQSLVPSGAAAETEPGQGPGAPYFEDASPEFRRALHVVNFDLADPAARSEALTVVLAQARKRDALTLLNLFRRVRAEERGRLFDRLAQLTPPPRGVDRQSVMDGNFQTLDAWWPELHLGSAKKGTKQPPRIEE